MREEALLHLGAPTPHLMLFFREDGGGTTKPTDHTGSGFSSSGDGNPGRGQSRTIREGLRTRPWQGRLWWREHSTASAERRSPANEGRGRHTVDTGCEASALSWGPAWDTEYLRKRTVGFSNGCPHCAPKADDNDYPGVEPIEVPNWTRQSTTGRTQQNYGLDVHPS